MSVANMRHSVASVLVLTLVFGARSDVNAPNSNDNLTQDEGVTPSISQAKQTVTFQDVKNYIQPILYQKLLRTPGDSPVLQEAKIVVSEYLVDSLLEQVQNSAPPEPVKSQEYKQLRQATNTTATRPTTGSRPTTIINVISGGLNITRPRPSQQHVIGQVDRIIQNVNGANITGIVDQALLIRAPPGVRQLVNGIMNIVLCNPFNRLWNRCGGGGSLLDSIAGKRK